MARRKHTQYFMWLGAKSYLSACVNAGDDFRICIPLFSTRKWDELREKIFAISDELGPNNTLKERVNLAVECLKAGPGT